MFTQFCSLKLKKVKTPLNECFCNVCKTCYKGVYCSSSKCNEVDFFLDDKGFIEKYWVYPNAAVSAQCKFNCRSNDSHAYKIVYGYCATPSEPAKIFAYEFLNLKHATSKLCELATTENFNTLLHQARNGNPEE